MQVQVEDVGPCKKLLRIEIPAERVTQQLEEAYKQLSDTVVVPGFRKGHAPRRLMERKFGKQVNDDARGVLMSESFETAVKDNNLRPIGQPKFDEEIEILPGEPLAFEVTVEVQPEFEIEGYSDLHLEKPATEPTPEEMEERIQAVRRRYATLVDVTEGSPQAEDVVTCHITLSEGDSLHRDVPNHQFIVGQHVLIGMTEEETMKFGFCPRSR